MAFNAQKTSPRRNLPRRDEGEPLGDGGYACLDAEWDAIERDGFGLLNGMGHFPKRCERPE